MTATDPGPQITLDQQVALRTAATRLQGEFQGTFGVETIDRFLMYGYAEEFSKYQKKALGDKAPSSHHQ